MRNFIKYIFIISFGILCFSTTCAYSQENAPTFQSLISSGDKEYAKKEYIKAKAYYQEALRLRPKDASAKSKLDNTLQKIREENKKEELFFEHIDNGDNFYSNNEDGMQHLHIRQSVARQLAGVVAVVLRVRLRQ